MDNLIDYGKGLVNAGDDSRIVACMKRAIKGEPIKVAFIGGSITQGSLALTPQTCYAYLTYKWWQEAFKPAVITYINAGIGGTTSHLGVGRVEEDVLSKSPDFVVVEFSVNDDDNSAHFQETYEGLVRKILRAPFAPALLLVQNVRYDDGGNAEEVHLPIAKRYHLPCVSMKPSIYYEVASGNIKKRDITPDDLHPNDAGHAMIAGVITHYLETILEKAKTSEPVRIEEALPDPLTPNGYENAVRFRNDKIQPVLIQGFSKDESPQENVADCFKKGWQAENVGDKIVFEVEGSSIGVQYRKTIRKPAPIAKITIDKDASHTVILDANFEEEWGDCLYLETVMEHGSNGRHEVEIEIIQEQKDCKEKFYLVSLIIA